MIVDTLKLAKPVTIGEETIEKLEFKELKARHIRGISAKPKMEDFFQLISISTGVGISFINEMSIPDVQRAIEVVSNFFFDGQSTGEA